MESLIIDSAFAGDGLAAGNVRRISQNLASYTIRWITADTDPVIFCRHRLPAAGGQHSLPPDCQSTILTYSLFNFPWPAYPFGRTTEGQAAVNADRHTSADRGYGFGRQLLQDPTMAIVTAICF